ncbi:nucleotide-binding universal stress UspA family protein [Tamaricihabitans halophyticus]|uniref:Nucleotide-binding universal stress UspA family protein n=1 Tax=Tamaricihabitans halophyticus TaxID=1262583 RepID=A0A4R2QFP9_9PSEU|nr:universal stress protein [Tamaricihabitans halophyticus]TCP47897.1 nucleotide-binding universal stress UspA family protein [Tamaricihabitans halophyticus]
MASSGRRPIVVGVDGSRSAVSAVRWAADAARLRDAPLAIVHCYTVPTAGYPDFVTTLHELREGIRARGEQWLAEATTTAREVGPNLRVHTELREAQPVPLLLAMAHDAQLVVLGSHGLGGFTGMLLGSTAQALAAHGNTPVAVIRHELVSTPPAPGPIVVGLDGSPASETALGLAFEEARLRATGLTAVRVWRGPMPGGSAESGLRDAETRRELAHQLDGWRDKYPEVAIDQVTVRGRPAPTLLRYAEHAQLVVVGSRGRGGFRGLLLGSTSNSLLHHARCPVLVARESSAGAPAAEHSESAPAISTEEPHDVK